MHIVKTALVYLAAICLFAACGANEDAIWLDPVETQILPAQGTYVTNMVYRLTGGKGKYTGTVVGRTPEGDGTFVFDDNSLVYIGSWENGVPHGEGTCTYADGDTYIGEWINGVPGGQGAYTWANGAKYEGGFKDGRFYGQGTKTYSDGSQYVGNWKDDERDGYGTYTWADGGKYEGEFKNDKRCGQGTLTLPNGEKQTGTWKDDEFVGKEYPSHDIHPPSPPRRLFA